MNSKENYLNMKIADGKLISLIPHKIPLPTIAVHHGIDMVNGFIP